VRQPAIGAVEHAHVDGQPVLVLGNRRAREQTGQGVDVGADVDRAEDDRDGLGAPRVGLQGQAFGERVAGNPAPRVDIAPDDVASVCPSARVPREDSRRSRSLLSEPSPSGSQVGSDPEALGEPNQPAVHAASLAARSAVGALYGVPILRLPPPRGARHVQEMVIYGVSFDMVGKQPIVLLKTVDSNKFLPIWIGHPEAAAILMKLQGASTPRPMTHDLLSDMLGELDVTCTRVSVTELRENTFYASITLAVNGRELEIDSRPSDALALAVRAGAPIFAAEDVIAESAIEFEHEVEDTEEVVEKFKDFLENVNPEDFAGGEE
jgi:bifunctional DNase/RNase